MSKLFGDGVIHPDSLSVMRDFCLTDPTAKWAVYQNMDLGHSELGHMKFLAVGPNCTYKEPPARLPDMPRQINWRYVHVGFVNLEIGKGEELENE